MGYFAGKLKQARSIREKWEPNPLEQLLDKAQREVISDVRFDIAILCDLIEELAARATPPAGEE